MTPAPEAPGAPTGVSVTSGNGSATVSFTPPIGIGASGTSYTVTAAPVRGGTPVTATGTASPIKVTGLTNGAGYTFSVTATNGSGSGSSSSASAPFTPAVTVPSDPTGVNVSRTNGGAVVRFIPPTDDGGSAITSYTVTATPVGDGTLVTATGTSSPINVSGLTNGTGYSFSVTATNQIGSGSAVGSPAVIIPSVTSPTTPGPATDITVVKTTNGVSVNFTPPVDNGGSTITGYTVIASPVGGGTNIQSTGKSSPIAVSGLSVGMDYSFSVLATNANGTTALASANSSAPLSFKGTVQQTIALSAPGDRQADSDPFSLTAVASSELPVTLSIISGPAMLTGNTITLTGGVGIVTIRATQPGNGIYTAASDVTTSFRVRAAPVNVYFGSVTSPSSTAKIGEIAAVLTPKTNQCSILIVAPAAGISTSVTFTLDANGNFTANISSPSSLVSGASVSGEPQRAAAPVPYSLRGRLSNGRIQGVIDPSGIIFDTALLSADGPSASSAGFYESTALGSGTGKTYAVVGTGNQVLTLASTPEVTVGGVTQLKADRTIEFGAQLNSAPVLVNLKVDPDATTIEGGVSVAGKTAISVAGLLNTTIPTDRVINLSSRGTSGNGRTFISGFVISGTDRKRVLIRAVGPGLARFGLPGVLANPKLEVYNSAGRVILENDDWVSTESAAAILQVGAFSLVEGSKDAAILTMLDPGAYTIHVTSNGSDGVALAEIYDASVNPNSDFQRLINISTRGEVVAGDGILIGGFVVTGNAPTRVLIRGIGPSLSSFGLSGVLADPRLRVYRGSELIAENDNWASNPAEADAGVQAASEAGAFRLMSGSKDAAMILTLAPGVYTAQISAADGISGGTALVEVYQLAR